MMQRNSSWHGSLLIVSHGNACAMCIFINEVYSQGASIEKGKKQKPVGETERERERERENS